MKGNFFVDGGLSQPESGDGSGKEVGEDHFVKFEKFTIGWPENEGNEKEKERKEESDDSVKGFIPGVIHASYDRRSRWLMLDCGRC